MNRKNKILLISYSAALVFIVTGLMFTSAGNAEGYRLSQDYEYRRAMAQLVSGVSDADEALQKGRYAVGAAMTGKVCAELMSAAQSASTALSILPLETNALEEVAGFLSQMEEYARVKGALAAGGTGFDAADRDMSGQLREVTARLVPALGEMYTQLTEGALSIRGWQSDDGLITDVADSYLEDEILALLADFPETPELIYPGKLSADHKNGYTAVSNLQKVTEDRALTAVRDLLGSDRDWKSMGKSEGELPCWYFASDTETVAVTERGGLPVLYLRDYASGESTVSEAAAKQAAQKFLERAGYDSLRELDAKEAYGQMEVIYVYADDTAEYLADTIRVTVAMDSGEVIALDAADYLRNHKTEISAQKPAVTAEEAAETAVPENMTVSSSELTWFTGDTDTATLCWRFEVRDEAGETCTIYADAETGEQTEIRTDGGNSVE